jgi:hypothetical protein
MENDYGRHMEEKTIKEKVDAYITWYCNKEIVLEKINSIKEMAQDEINEGEESESDDDSAIPCTVNVVPCVEEKSYLNNFSNSNQIEVEKANKLIKDIDKLSSSSFNNEEGLFTKIDEFLAIFNELNYDLLPNELCRKELVNKLLGKFYEIAYEVIIKRIEKKLESTPR